MSFVIGEEGQTGDHNNTVDVIFQSVHKTVDVVDEHGNIKKVQIMDDLSLWCKTLSVATNKLGNTIFNMMEFARSGLSASNNMCKERAVLWAQETMEIVESIKKTLDSKSSESIVDSNNKQSTLIDKINKNSVEKIYTMKDVAKRSIFDSIMGKEKDKISDD